jgi:HEAT repeat protein
VAVSADEPRACNPVEHLRQVLADSSAGAAAREEALHQCLHSLLTAQDLMQALDLREWREQRAGDPLSVVDRAARQAFAEQFEQVVRTALGGADTTAVAMAQTLARAAGEARSTGQRPVWPRLFAVDLAKRTASGSNRLRARAARALGQVEPAPEVAVPALESLLNAAEPELRQAAAEGLTGLLPALWQSAAWVVAGAPGIAVRDDALRTAVRLAPVAGRGLTHSDQDVRSSCAAILRASAATLGRLAASPLPPDLLETDREEAQRRNRADLQLLANGLGEQAQALARAVGDTHWDIRMQALAAVEQLAKVRGHWVPQGSSKDVLREALVSLVPALAEAARDSEVRVRLEAVSTLEMLGLLAAPAVPALVEALEDSNRFVRWTAVRTLGALGAAAGDAWPGLSRVLEDTDLDLRLAAAAALEQLAPDQPEHQDPRLLDALTRALHSPEAELRVAALQTLRSLRLGAQPAVPAVCEILADPHARVRRAAALTLAALGPSARATDRLRQMFQDPAPEVRQAAREALRRVEPAPSP